MYAFRYSTAFKGAGNNLNGHSRKVKINQATFTRGTFMPLKMPGRKAQKQQRRIQIGDPGWR